MNKHITDRRIAFVKQFLLIRDVKLAAQRIQTQPEFKNDSIDVILRDWGRRNTWLEAVVRITDPTVLQEIAAEIKWVLDQAHTEYLRCVDVKEKIRGVDGKEVETGKLFVNNASNRLRALGTVREAAQGLADVLLETGKLHKAPIEIQATVTDEIDISKLSEQDRSVLVAAAKIVESQGSKSQS